MEEQQVNLHGSLCKQYQWQPPKLVAESHQLSRPGYSTLTANEYTDSKPILKSKIQLLAKLIKASSQCLVYTGAGISRASGIADYATKAKNSIAQTENHSLNRLNAVPSKVHHVIAAMEQKGYVKHWLQQNHDGLAQKAGFPKSKLNEIHGSWFDKKNPVVLMDDCLNPKNYKMLEEWEEKVDLCLAIGTSLSGMRSDGIAKAASLKNGLVIINLQKTPYDQTCAIRIYGSLQEVLWQLSEQLKLKVANKVYTHQSEWKK